MVQHLVDGARHRRRVEREEPEHDEAEVRDRGVGDELLQVRLHGRHQRAVDDAGDGEADHERRRRLHRAREEGQREAEEPVGPHLEQHARQDDRAAGRRLDVRVGEPGVEREERHLDGEGEREGGEQPELLAGREGEPREPRLVGEARRPGHAPGAVEDRDQHEEAAGHREEHELERRVDAARPAPHPDQEVHRDEHDLPEDVEEEHVEGDERAEHAGLEHEQEGEELLHPAVDVAPRGEHDDRREHGGEQHEEEAHAVHAQAVLDPPLRDPGHLLGHLEARDADLEAPEHLEREHERHEREGERRAPDAAHLLARQERQQGRARERGEDDERQQHQRVIQ